MTSFYIKYNIKLVGYKEPCSSIWKAKPLTKDHKPESVMEMTRIEQCGGKVIIKSGG